MSRQKKILITIGSIAALMIIAQVWTRLDPGEIPEKWVIVEYGGIVDVNDRTIFESLYRKSLACSDGIGHESPNRCVSGAWYDRENRYMIIGLGRKPSYYHYCGFPPTEWAELLETDHLYDHYSNSIYQRFDCRESARSVPEYAKLGSKNS